MPTSDAAEAHHAWANALELGARGRYGEALALLSPLLESDDPVHYAMGVAVRAHHLRELGALSDALELDNDALLFWEDAQIPLTWPYLDLKIGRSYDALLAGRPAEAGEWLEDALGLEEIGDDRTAVRLVWCAAELALALDKAGEALDLLASSAPRLRSANQPRLDVTTMLLHGQALAAIGEAHAAASVLDEVLRIAAEGRWHSLMVRAAMSRAEVATSEKERHAFYSAAKVLIELICQDLDEAERERLISTLPAEAHPSA